jgi:hypothetical protein
MAYTPRDQRAAPPTKHHAARQDARAASPTAEERKRDGPGGSAALPAAPPRQAIRIRDGGWG